MHRQPNETAITGLARSPCMGRAGPGRASMIVCGPGRAGCGPETCRPGQKKIAGCGPGLDLTFPGLSRARAYTVRLYKL